ncbi:hypothetical protein LL962_17980 [Xanthomonas sp. NCPPB 1067]|uniref:hypothetical protein n=1 Tax=Xanthomonas sp. NCPPB 1067 TaxID=487524 RepID=UPI001E5411D8|nr:hypothetical protein [Xanthomonas sp. NCPPB 1067]MCC4588966.1 hypothetical protein [Xanthomonas sp. NCPPB 1067]
MSTCLFFATSVVIARDAGVSGNNVDASIDQRLLDQEVAPIRSRAELREYLRVMPAQSPLLLLSYSSRERFLNSLVFSENGLASYSYEDLVAQLNALDAYKVLSLFGQQATVKLIPGLRQTDGFSQAIMAPADSTHLISRGYGPTASKEPDYPDYACVAKATCGQSMGKICIGANC